MCYEDDSAIKLFRGKSDGMRRISQKKIAKSHKKHEKALIEFKPPPTLFVI